MAGIPSCPICLEDLKAGNLLVIAAVCNHVLCLSCALSHYVVHSGSTCPYCRQFFSRLLITTTQDHSNTQEARMEEVAVSEFLPPAPMFSSDIVSMQSTPRKGPALPVSGVEDLNGWRSSKEVKTVRFPPGKKLSSSQGGPTTQVSNIFSMLDNR